MKKLLVVLTVLVLSLAVFAEVTVSGPNFTTGLRYGYAAFGLRLDENGMDIYSSNSTQGKAYWSFAAVVADPSSAEEDATVSINLGNPAAGNTNVWQSLSLISGTFENNLLKVAANFYGYEDVLSNYTLWNTDANGDGNIDDPIGRAYMVTTLKDYDLDVLYITLAKDYTVTTHSTANYVGNFLLADVFATKKSLDLSVGSVNAAAVFMATDPVRTTLTDAATTGADGEYLGFSADANFTAKDALEGLTANVAFGMQSAAKTTSFDKSAFLVRADYTKDMEVSDMVTVTPHGLVYFNTDMSVLPFAKPTSAASKIAVGADVAFDLGDALGTVSLTDTVTLPFVGDMTTKVAATYKNSFSELANVEATFEKQNSSNFASPMALSAKVSGSTSMDMVDVSYFVAVSDFDNVNKYNKTVSLTDIASVTDKYMPYEVKVVVKPVDKTSVTFRLYNYTTDPDYGNYNLINSIAEPCFTLDAAYKPYSFTKVGAHVGSESNWGKIGAIHWYLTAEVALSF